MNDPFGRNDRTIILPDPGGRGRMPDAPPAPAEARSYQPTPHQPTPHRPAPYPAPFHPPTGRERPASETDDWATSDLSARRPAAAPAERVRALVMKRDVVVAPNANPLLRTAAPLLLLLGRLRVQLSTASFSNLMEQVAASIEDLEKDARAAGVDAEQVRAAKYIVCATADDIVQNIPTDERHVWTQYSMLSRFFGERVGGVRFFEQLDRAKLDPIGNYHLLELIHACLGIGFQGVHRTGGGGAANLQRIQRELYELLRRTRTADREISPRWQGQAIPPEARRLHVPLWAAGSLVGAVLLGLFLLLRTLLVGNAEATATELAQLHPLSEVSIQRRVYAPPPPPPPPPAESQAGKFQDALKAEINDSAVSVIESGNQIVLRLAAALFRPADARVKPDFVNLLKRLAGLLEKSTGPVKIVGHTDAIPIKTVLFPSNFVLSEARAKAVADILKTGLSKPDRVTIEGKGADVPIASNKTPEGRARNRRVDIVVPRER